jgi:hypothetical protein
MEISTEAIRFKVWLDFPEANVDMVITPKLSGMAGRVETKAGNKRTPTEKSVYQFLHIAGGEDYESCETVATSEFMMGRCYVEFETEEISRLPEIIEGTKKRVLALAKKHIRYHNPIDVVSNSRVGAFSR